MEIATIIIAAVVSFIFGWLWYGPLFGKTWMKLSEVNMEDMKRKGMTPAKSMAFGFISSLVVAYVLSMFMGMLSVTETGAAINLAFWIWLGFAMPIQAGTWLWEGRSFNLFLFNTVYQLIVYGLMASTIVIV